MHLDLVAVLLRVVAEIEIESDLEEAFSLLSEIAHIPMGAQRIISAVFQQVPLPRAAVSRTDSRRMACSVLWTFSCQVVRRRCCSVVFPLSWSSFLRL